MNERPFIGSAFDDFRLRGSGPMPDPQFERRTSGFPRSAQMQCALQSKLELDQLEKRSPRNDEKASQLAVSARSW